MSDRPELSQDTAVNHSQAEIVCLPTCDESGLGEDEKKVEVTEIAPFPPVGLITASSPVANSTDNESELSELTISRLDACEGVVKVEFRSSKDEDDAPKDCDSRNDQSGRSLEIDSEVPPFYEDGAEMMDDSKSVACQTDWSWLAAYRAIEHKLPQQSSSRILKSKSGSKMSKSSDVDIPQTVEMTASSLFDDLENNTRLLDSLKSDPWPDRTDEYGIPIYPASEDEEFLNEDAVPVEGRNEAESKQEVTKEDEGKTNEGVDEDNDEDSDKDEDEDDDDDEEDDDDNEDDEDDDMEESLEQHLDGICRFCGQEKKPLPSPEDQEKKSLDELYCCSEFREYITRILAKTEQSRTEKVEGGQKSRKTGQGRSSRASSSMSGPSGVEGIEWKTKARKKKVRASIGSEGRGRRSKKQKKSLRDSMLDEDQFRSSSRSQQNSRSGGMKNDGSDKPCVVYGRDATTITYQLSSRQCMNWTLGVDGGATSRRRPETARVVKPVQQQGRSPRLDSQMGLVCQTYEDGSPFLVIFADGSGNVLYLSSDGFGCDFPHWDFACDTLRNSARDPGTERPFSSSDLHCERKIGSVRADTAGSSCPEFPPTEHSFVTLKEISAAELRSIIVSSAPKSCELDSIPATLIQDCIDDLLPFLTLLCNRSLQEGVLPDSQKKSVIYPAIKRDGLDSDDPANFRPISNVSFR